MTSPQLRMEKGCFMQFSTQRDYGGVYIALTIGGGKARRYRH